MYKLDDILAKTAGFLEYSIQQKPELKEQYEKFISDFNAVAGGYFNANRSGWETTLTEFQYDLFSYFTKKFTVYQDKSLNIPDIPEFYSDMLNIFLDVGFIMNLSASEFFGEWVYETKTTGTEGGSATTEIVVVGHTMIDTWTDVLSSAVNSELNLLNTSKMWFEGVNDSAGLTLLYEDMGTVLSAPTKEQIADSIFKDMNFAECIKDRNLPTYIPSYI